MLGAKSQSNMLCRMEIVRNEIKNNFKQTLNPRRYTRDHTQLTVVLNLEELVEGLIQLEFYTYALTRQLGLN